MKRYLNVRSAGRWMVALVPLLMMAAAFSGWHGVPAFAGESREVSPMDRQQPERFETATFALG
jgi:hypothetical protein